MEASPFETGQVAMSQLAVEEEQQTRDRNEATTRLHLIDTIVFGALRWRRQDCRTEEPLDNSYTDYSLGSPATQLIVEAKKEGEYFTLPDTSGHLVVRISTLLRENNALAAAIRQAISYCASRGVRLGAVTNGHQLVAFLGSREDGIAPTHGQAVVFRSLREMEERFVQLWNYLSPEGIARDNLYELLRSSPRQLPPEKLSHRLYTYPGTKRRNELEIELGNLGELFLQDIVKDKELEDNFLRECYCTSGALSQYALVSREILKSRYAESVGSKTQQATAVTTKAGISAELLEAVVRRGVSRRPVILLGDVGVGKTTFIRHLVKVDAKEELENAIVLYLDFGSEPALRRDLESFVSERFAGQLIDTYGIDIHEDQFVRAVYNSELNRFAKSVFRKLRDTDPTRYEHEELRLLTERTGQLESHLRASIEHMMATQGKKTVVFFDNIDQRDVEFQDAVYLIAQSMSETWNVTTFVSLRPDTFNTSRSSGSLAAYQPRVFTISPPRIDNVIVKRLQFAQTVVESPGGISLGAEGITLDSSLLRDYVQVLIISLKKNAQLCECLDNVSRGNVRSALDLLTAFVGSGHVDSRKILRIFRTSGHYVVALHEFLRAIIYGSYEHYDPKSSPVMNVFDIASQNPKEHFLVPIILNLLDRQSQLASVERGFVRANVIFAHCQALGFTDDEVEAALIRSVSGGQLEASDSGSNSQAVDESYRITQSGAYLVRRLLRMFVYYDAVVVDTPILSDEVRPRLTEARIISDRLDRAADFIEYLDSQFEHFGNLDTGFSWKSVAADVEQDMSKIWERLERSQQRI